MGSEGTVYCPFLRGKQYELLALNECADKIARSRKVVPIIEPVKAKLDNLKQTLHLYRAHSLRYIFVVNPRVGDLRYEHAELRNKIDGGDLPIHERAYLAYVITRDTEAQDVEGFLDHYRGRNLAVIHWSRFADPQQLLTLFGGYGDLVQIFIDSSRGQPYRDLFRDFRRILIRDGFKRVANTDYPPDEPFSDLHSTYASMGMQGFGDFCTIGRNYANIPPQPFAVAVHLTYPRGGGEVSVRHFLSDNNLTQGFTAAKLFEAVRKLVDFIDANPLPFSSACDQFRRLYRNRSPRTPGYTNGLSTKHHLELMMHLLR